MEVRVVVEQVDQGDLRIVQLHTASLALALDDLQFRDPVDAIREAHRIAAVLLDHLSP